MTIFALKCTTSSEILLVFEIKVLMYDLSQYGMFQCYDEIRYYCVVCVDNLLRISHNTVSAMYFV